MNGANRTVAVGAIEVAVETRTASIVTTARTDTETMTDETMNDDTGISDTAIVTTTMREGIAKDIVADRLGVTRSATKK